MENEAAVRLGFFFGVFILVAIWEGVSPRRVLNTSKTIRWISNMGIVLIDTMAVRLLFPLLAIEMERIKTAIKLRVPQKNEKLHTQKNGETQYFDVTIYPLLTNGVEGAVIRMDDITERIRIEEMMIQSEKMMSVGGLAAGMAHEINNPLAGILQSMQVIQNRLKKKYAKKQTDCRSVRYKHGGYFFLYG